MIFTNSSKINLQARDLIVIRVKIIIEKNKCNLNTLKKHKKYLKSKMKIKPKRN